MQTYIVIGLIVAAAGYVAYGLLRRLGFFGAPAGCGCGCAGCPSLPPRAGQGKSELRALSAAEKSGSCGGCAGGCGQQPPRADRVEIAPRS